MDKLLTELWVLATVGRLAGLGLLDRKAPDADELATSSQRLLVEAGWLDAETATPTERATRSVPPGVALAAAAGYVQEQLSIAERYAAGAAPGWSVDDPALIRWRGGSSAMIVSGLFAACFAHVPGFPERLAAPGARFLDVGCGAAGIATHLCRQFPSLQAVGLDVHAPAIKVAREDVAAAGLDRRIEIREQSVGELDDVEAYDLLWVPQSFIPRDVLNEALPRLFGAARRNAVLVMALASNRASGAQGLANEVRALMEGGGTMRVQQAAELVSAAGFTEVQPISGPVGDVVIAVRP